MNPDRLVTNCCSHPGESLESLLAIYSSIGFPRLEAFLEWTRSPPDYLKDCAEYKAVAARFNMRFDAIHMTQIPDADPAHVERAVRAVRFASELGCRFVYFRAVSVELYASAAPAVLDACSQCGVIPVLEQHDNTYIASLAQVRSVLDAVGDPRLKIALEIGHLRLAGDDWRKAWGDPAIRSRVANVYLKDLNGRDYVGWGQADVPIEEIVRVCESDGFSGPYVIEMLVKDRKNASRYLAEAFEKMRSIQ